MFEPPPKKEKKESKKLTAWCAACSCSTAPMSRFFLGAALASDSNRVRRTASNLIAGSEMVALITIIYKEEPSLSNHKEITVTLDPKRMFFVKQFQKCKNELATPSEAKSGSSFQRFPYSLKKGP